MSENKNTKTASNGVGVIGQRYENRKTKKVGIIESRNEKYKTLLMRDDDGKTFNVVYSTFKSEWRKAAVEADSKDDVDADKSVEKAVTKSEKKEGEKKTKEEEKKAKAEAKKKAHQEKVIRTTETMEIVAEMIEKSGVNLIAKKNARGCVVVKRKNVTVCEIWIIDDGSFAVCLKKPIELNVKHELIEHDNWLVPYEYRVTGLKGAMDDVISVAKREEKELDKKETKNTDKVKEG